LCFYLEELNRLEEAINVVNKMLQPERTNPFPSLSFLIEGRAYHNTGNMLHELKDRLTRKLEEPVINLESIKFDFK
jgi:hypothetical protein